MKDKQQLFMLQVCYIRLPIRMKTVKSHIFQHFILVFIIALNDALFNYDNRCWKYCTICVCTICVLSHFVLAEGETWIYLYLKLNQEIYRMFNN